MNTVWFDATVAWLPGTLLGVAGGMFGALVGFAWKSAERRKRWQAMLSATYWLIFGLSAGMLSLAIAVLLVRQPREVWFALLNPGLLGTCLFGPLSFYAVRSLVDGKKAA